MPYHHKINLKCHAHQQILMYSVLHGSILNLRNQITKRHLYMYISTMQQATIWLCAVSSCLTLAPRFLSFFYKKEQIQTQKTQQCCEGKWLVKQNHFSWVKAAVLVTFAVINLFLTTWVVYWSCMWLWPCALLSQHWQKTASMLAQKKKKKRFLYRSEERRPKRLQVLIQLGL